MIGHKVVTQPLAGVEYRTLLTEVARAGAVKRLDAAVAYATHGGAVCLVELLTKEMGASWKAVNKRWLVGIDWLRSQPEALDLLDDLENSGVRIHDGKSIVSRLGCTPKLPFHPKVFLFDGEQLDAAVIGSGNLSRNGLLRGHEVGTAIFVGVGSDEVAKVLRNQLRDLSAWFEALWKQSTPWSAIRSKYLSVYESKTNFVAITPTDDDAADTDDVQVSTGTRAFSPNQLRQLRAARSFWIEAGTLSKNRGPTLPGNQLMMKRFTRVFFDVPARDVPRDTHVGIVKISHGKFVRDDCTIRFSNNGMDVLLLPVPGQGGPPTYDDRILCFEREKSGTFALTVHPLSAVGQFTKRSDTVGARFGMSGSGRRFGVY